MDTDVLQDEVNGLADILGRSLFGPPFLEQGEEVVEPLSHPIEALLCLVLFGYRRQARHPSQLVEQGSAATQSLCGLAK
jgi:hypothetical protein